MLGDILRNMGGPPQRGVRLIFERLLKVAYGLSVLAAVPWLLIPMHNILALALPSADGSHVDETTLLDPPSGLRA